MPRTSTLRQRNEDLARVAKIIQTRLRELHVSAGTVAERAGIDAGHLSKVIRKPHKGTHKRLSEAKLAALADVLGVARGELLAAAGLSGSEGGTDPATRIAQLPSVSRSPLRVITDPRFYDSAFFMWVFSKQPLRPLGIECQLEPVYWESVPARVATSDYAIGFFNRRAIQRGAGWIKYDVRHATDLTLYKAYALLLSPALSRGNRGLRQALMSRGSLRHAEEFLRKLIRKRSPAKPVIVTMQGDTVWRLNTLLTTETISEKKFHVEEYADAELALQQFLSGKVGDLFIGGLAQRLSAREDGCIELFSFANNPMLWSFNSLIYSPLMTGMDLPTVNTAASVWFNMVGAARADELLRKSIHTDVVAMLRDIGVERHSLKSDVFKWLLSGTPDAQEFEIFADRPGALTEPLLQIVRSAAELLPTKDKILDCIDGFLETISTELPIPQPSAHSAVT